MKTTNNSGFIFKKSTALVLGLAFATLLSCEKDNLNDSASTSAADVTTEIVSGNLTRKTYSCSSASAIQSALDSAVAGDIITIAAGTYTGEFSSSKSGTSSSYITIQGAGTSTILTCGSTASGNTGLEISGKYWNIKNLSVTKASIGVKLDNSDYSRIESVTVSNTGQEGIHLLNGTSNVTIYGCKVTDTGNVTTKYGEGIYIGSDYGKWLENGGTYDKACNYNTIDSCIVGPDVTAEHIDVKEGSRYLTIKNSVFYGTGISGETGNNSNSFIEVKGSNCTITGNTLYQENNTKILWAFQVTDSGAWGDTNVFTSNKAYLTGSSVVYLQVTNFSSFTGEPTGNTLDSTNIRYTTTATTANTYNYDSTGSRK